MSNNGMQVLCLVDGKCTDQRFMIRAPSCTSVEDLRGIIKYKISPEFDKIAQNKLNIWRVSVPIPEDGETPISLKNIPETERKKLGPEAILKNKIRGGFSEHIRVIVEPHPGNIGFILYFWVINMMIIINTNQLHYN